MTIAQINPVLLDLAAWKANAAEEKRAFVPSEQVAAAAGGGGGAPPMDPMAGGGMPPMDPAAAGAAPPMDPMAGGGAPPPMPTPPPVPGGTAGSDLKMMVQQAVQEAMGGAGGMGGGQAAPGSPGAGAPGGKVKVDPAMLYMEVGRVRKLLTGLYQHMGYTLPPDILDDQTVAMTAMGQQPTSQPIGAEGGAAAGGPPSPGGAPPGGAAPAPAAPPSAGAPMAPQGGGEKTAGVTQPSIMDVLGFSSGPASPDMQQERLQALAKLSRGQ